MSICSSLSLSTGLYFNGAVLGGRSKSVGLLVGKFGLAGKFVFFFDEPLRSSVVKLSGEYISFEI